MPLSFNIGFPECPNKQRWSWVVARSSSREDMMVQVGPDGSSLPGATCSPS